MRTGEPVRVPVNPTQNERWRSAAGGPRHTDARPQQRAYTFTGPAASPPLIDGFLAGRVIPGVALPYTIVRHRTVPKDDKEAVPWWYGKSLVNKANKAA
jgi:hypothetical protein